MTVLKVSHYTIPLKLQENEYLLINSRTGAVDLVNSNIVDILQGTLHSSEVDPSIVDFFVERGHLTDMSQEEELKYLETLYRKYYEVHSKFKTHMIIPTYNCNFQCSYCYLSDIQSKDSQWLNTVIDDDHIERLFKVITHIDGSHRGRLVLYGGEPLLLKNKKVIENILKRGTMLGYRFTITTNGVSLSDFLDVIQIYNPVLQITIDGPQSKHDSRRIKKDGSGTFNEILAGVDAALESNLTILLRMNLDSKNLDTLPQMIDFYREKGFYNNPNISIHFSPVFQKSCGTYEFSIPRKDVYKAVVSQTAKQREISQISFDLQGIKMFETIFQKGGIESPRFWYCDANLGMFIYDPFGDIYVCTEHIGQESTRAGQYYPKLSWNDSCKRWRERTVFTIPECRKCKYAPFCGGGCGFEALKHYSTLSKPICSNFPNIFNLVIPHLYKTLRDDYVQT